MVDEQNEKSTDVYVTSTPYLVYIILVGIPLFLLLIYLGFIGYNFWVTVLVGGVAQVIFRVSKKTWSNLLNRHAENDRAQKDPIFTAILESIPTITIFVSLYVAMVLVCGLLYGFGSMIGWVFNR